MLETDARILWIVMVSLCVVIPMATFSTTVSATNNANPQKKKMNSEKKVRHAKNKKIVGDYFFAVFEVNKR